MFESENNKIGWMRFFSRSNQQCSVTKMIETHESFNIFVFSAKVKVIIRPNNGDMSLTVCPSYVFAYTAVYTRIRCKNSSRGRNVWVKNDEEAVFNKWWKDNAIVDRQESRPLPALPFQDDPASTSCKVDFWSSALKYWWSSDEFFACLLPRWGV